MDRPRLLYWDPPTPLADIAKMLVPTVPTLEDWYEWTGVQLEIGELETAVMADAGLFAAEE